MRVIVNFKERKGSSAHKMSEDCPSRPRPSLFRAVKWTCRRWPGPGTRIGANCLQLEIECDPCAPPFENREHICDGNRAEALQGRRERCGLRA